jgi:hypothetical protein
MLGNRGIRRSCQRWIARPLFFPKFWPFQIVLQALAMEKPVVAAVERFGGGV